MYVHLDLSVWIVSGAFAFMTALRNPFDRAASHYAGFGPAVKDLTSQT